MTVRCLIDAKNALGESPVWDVDEQCLWWSDIHGRALHRCDHDGSAHQTWSLAEMPGCIAPMAGGGLVVTLPSGLYPFHPDTGLGEVFLETPMPKPELRYNDGATDRQGRFWVGTMKDGGAREAIGQFARFDTDLQLHHTLPGFYTTNGCAFSPDGKTMYLSDSYDQVQTIWAFDYDTDTGTPSNRRVFFDTREVAGRPDGGTVDSDGCYWMAGVSGSQVVRITTEGVVDRIIDMPVERPTKPMFGGPDLKTLFVTSIGGACDDPAQPLAGGLFVIEDHGCQGVPEVAFRR